MTGERWKQVEALFEQTLEAPAAERPEFLQRIEDADLRGEVESLLEAHREAGAFLDEPDRFFSSESLEVDTLSPGQVIERYRIIRELGRGGMGAVFLAERADDEYKKQVALKLIKRGTDTDVVLRHFRNERQILAGFDHPNIARLFDGGTTDTGLPYFVMEYVEGLPIGEFCNTNSLSVVERLELFREVCAAVSYAHRRLVIHRDIKRSNILVTADGVPKLLDFGIAKLLQEQDGVVPQPTMMGLHLMTPASASPEQLRGQAVTTATDVYSLGVVLYELLSGRSPYQFDNQAPHEMARVITSTEPRKPSSAVTDANFNSKSLKGDLDNIVLMALRKEPDRRYQSVEQFSEDIRRHLEERTVLARKDTLGYRSSKFIGRNKVAVAAAALVLFSLIGAIIATSRQAHVARWEKARAERRFKDVRKLANSVLFDYHDAIKDLPGATKVRERLVKDGLNYLDSLANEANGDPDLQRELAAAYERVGDVLGGVAGGASLGDKAGAIESYTKALRIRESLLALNPNDPRARRDLARSHHLLGERLPASDDNKDLEHLRKALTLYVDLAREQPSNDEVQLDLAQTHDQLGGALSAHDDVAGALEQFRAGLAICEKLVLTNPRDRKCRHSLWTSYSHVGYMLWLKDDAAGAIEATRKALELGEALLAADPINADYRRDLVLNYQNAGDILTQSDKGGALDRFRRALALDEELLAADPANALTRKDLAYTHKRVADFLVDLRNDSEALPHFSKALEGYQRDVTEAQGGFVSRFLVVSCRAGVAQMQAKLGEVELALEECRKAVAALQEITGDEPGHLGRAQACEYIASAYVALAASPKVSTSESRQHTSAARDMFRGSLAVLDELRNREGTLGPNDAWAKEIAGEIAKCDAALGN